MSRDIEERIRMFMTHHLGHSRDFDLKRVALNMNQVEEYNPPPNPAKNTDSRFQAYVDLHGDESWELDALEPTVIAGLIRNEVIELRDEAVWRANVATELEARRDLTKVAERWDEVVDFVN